MIGLNDFKILIKKLSALTGRPLLNYGKRPSTQETLDYVLTVFHDELKQYDHLDIEGAFNNQEMQDEIVKFGFNCSTLRKYIRMHKNKRTSDEDQEQLEIIAEEKVIPEECKKKLASMGIHLEGMAEDMPESKGEDTGRREQLNRQAAELRNG